jgi:hypothetical protein
VYPTILSIVIDVDSTDGQEALGKAQYRRSRRKMFCEAIN